MSNRLTKEHLYHYILLNVLAIIYNTLKMLDIIDPMNVGKTFVERNERRKFQRFFIKSYFLNTQTTVKSRDVATLERKQTMPASKSVCLLQSSLIKSTLCHFSR